MILRRGRLAARIPGRGQRRIGSLLGDATWTVPGGGPQRCTPTRCSGRVRLGVSVYVYFSDTDEHEGLAQERGRFTDVRPSRPALADRQVALISYHHEEIAACARMTRSPQKAVSYKWLVTLDEFVSFDPLPFEELEQAVSDRAAKALRRAREYGGRQLDDAAGAEIIDGHQRASSRI